MIILFLTWFSVKIICFSGYVSGSIYFIGVNRFVGAWDVSNDIFWSLIWFYYEGSI